MRGQHHKRLAWVTVGGLALAALAVAVDIAIPEGETLWHMIAAPEEDGRWRFATIDGRDVRQEHYTLDVRWGEIAGYHDGCNSCGVTQHDPDSPYHSRTCTLMACAYKPNQVRFRRFLAGEPRMQMDGPRLILSVPGHRAVLVRQ